MSSGSKRDASARADARRCRQRGQGLVELAFLLPVIVVLWCALIDLGRINVKKQQVHTALDSVANMIQNQPGAMTTTQLQDWGCETLEESGALIDLGKNKADCVTNGWVEIDDPIPDTASTSGAAVYRVSVTLPVDPFLPIKIRLTGGAVYTALTHYDVSTGVRYVRSSLVVP